MPFHAFFGIALMSMSQALARGWYGAVDPPWGTTTLHDQHTGGAIAWAFGEIPTFIVLIVMAFQWYADDQRQARRLDRKADRAAKAGGRSGRTSWPPTTPAWPSSPNGTRPRPRSRARRDPSGATPSPRRHTTPSRGEGRRGGVCQDRCVVRVFRPLIERTTWQRWAHLVVGGALLMPYWFLAMSLTPLLPRQHRGDGRAHPARAAGGCGVRDRARPDGPAAGELAKGLLKGPAATLVPGSAHSWESRVRAAAWYTLHLGGRRGGQRAQPAAVPPFAVVMLLAPMVTWDTRFLETWGWRDGWHQWPAPLIGLASLAVLLALIVAAVAAGPARAAVPRPVRRREARRRGGQGGQAGRAQPAGAGTHDSVGHALSVVTLQAGAAGRVLDSDPAFAREALGAIEESARAALEDLDHVLGLLREDPVGPAPRATLKDLGRLLEQTRIAGVELDAEVEPEVEHVPAAVSREAYRIVQEGLTNALRHAARSRCGCGSASRGEAGDGDEQPARRAPRRRR